MKIKNKQECIPVGCVPSAAVAVRGGARPDPPQLPPWVWAWTWSPSIFPLGVGLDLIPLKFPLVCGPGDPPSSRHPPRSRHPPCGQNHRCLWKYNLAPTSLRAVKIKKQTNWCSESSTDWGFSRLRLDGSIITKHKHSLQRLCFYRCVSVHGGGVLSQHALQVVSQHALQQVLGGCDIPACLAGFQAHSQGGSLGGSGWEVWSRPTAKGEVEGDLVQAHTQGGSWGGSGQWGACSWGACFGGSTLGGCLLWGVPTPGGCLLGGGACSGGACSGGGACSAPPMTATAAGGTNSTGMHSCCVTFPQKPNEIGKKWA